MTVLSPVPSRHALEAWAAPAVRISLQHVPLVGICPVHWHDFHELFLVVSGAGTHELNGADLPMSRGYAAVVTPFDFHGFVSVGEEPLELLNVVFDDQLLSERGRLVLDTLVTHGRSCVTPDGDVDRVSLELRRIREEVEHDRPHRLLAVRATLERTLVALARLERAHTTDVVEVRTPGGHPSAAIREALRHLHHHFSEPVTLADLAGVAHLSPTYLSERFRAETGESFQSYLRALRVRFAASLLACSELSVTEVCFASGFVSLPHFSRAFRHVVGRTPSEYRRGPRRTG